MKEYIMYVCETCGKESSDYDDIYECEAKHLGLTVSEKQELDLLYSAVTRCSHRIMYSKNDETESAYDKAIHDLIAFEEAHGINLK